LWEVHRRVCAEDLIEKNAGTVHPRLGEQTPGDGGSDDIVGRGGGIMIKIKIKSRRENRT
jgi:hypothetical protein